MQANTFAILENSSNLSHAYLCYGDFAVLKDEFKNSLSKIKVNLNGPGHYILDKDTFTVDDAQELIAWYHKNQTSNDDPYTLAVIACSVIRKDAQQLLLKILEEARSPYIFFIFVKPGIEIIDTVISRVQIINTVCKTNIQIAEFVKSSKENQIKKVANDIKGMESSEIRAYTESLVRDIIMHLHENQKEEKMETIKKLLTVQNALVESRIAPKFILDYVLAVL